ncbi:MAG TPA: energy transducer TonB [Phenylobacterium sp.]
MLSAVIAMLLQGAQTVPPPSPMMRPSIITNPDWALRPNGEDVAAVYPPSALERGVGGRAVLACTVSATGLLVDCQASDEPAREGFGAAALALSSKFRMRPMTKDGMPIDGGKARIPIRFVAPPPEPIENPDWLPPPAQADPLRYYPEVAQKRGVEGAATIACIVTAQGALTGCKVETETPAGWGFGEAALQLAPLFRMKPKAKDSAPVAGRPVSIPIRFKLPR